MNNILVLNADFVPLSVTSFKKGFKLTYKGKAEIVETVKDDVIHTATSSMLRPSVIRLLRYVVYPYRKITLTRQNVFKRDGNACVYCGSKKDLTLDHVIPKSRGGRDSWENLVTCCQKCNAKKADRTPIEAGMNWHGIAKVPNHFAILGMNNHANETWKPYIFM
jgi:5-methylcytosine-specific restriction endonuclease McrA